MIVQKQRNQSDQAGKTGKKSYNDRSLYATLAGYPDKGIGHAGSQASKHTDERGWMLENGGSGFDYKKTAEKGNGDAGSLIKVHFFF